jgi:hypothetical protein
MSLPSFFFSLTSYHESYFLLLDLQSFYFDFAGKYFFGQGGDHTILIAFFEFCLKLIVLLAFCS